MPEGSPARSPQLADGEGRATVATTVGRRGARALVTVAGDCDLEFVTPLINGIDRLLQLLAADIPEPTRDAVRDRLIAVLGEADGDEVTSAVCHGAAFAEQ